MCKVEKGVITELHHSSFVVAAAACSAGLKSVSEYQSKDLMDRMQTFGVGNLKVFAQMVEKH